MNQIAAKPDFITNNDRRNFLKLLSAGWAATIAYPALGNTPTLSQPERNPHLLSISDDLPNERYWETVKKQFAVPADKIMVNAANLCPSPVNISDQILTSLKSLQQDVSFQNRAKFEDRRKLAIEMLAKHLQVATDEIGITRNTTEGNNIIVNGLDLMPGDEVIIWDQNHPTNSVAWEHRAKRYGFTVKKVAVPVSPKSAEELIAPFVQAITTKTKLIAFSHISNSSGIALPARKICQLARQKGILTLVDGAQSFGSMDLNLKEMSCDFYTGSTHKWLMGPIENGVLYVTKEQMGKVWPNMISAGWKETYRTVDEKLCVLGQRNDLTVSALPAILEFHQIVGKKNIERRVRQLSAYLKDQIKNKIPGASFITPLSPEMSGGIVIFKIQNKDNTDIYRKLYQNHGIAGAPTGGIRLSPHIYNTLTDLDKIVAALVTLSV